MMTTKLAASLCCSICLVAPCATAAEPKHTNRLARESSPYLLQHAHNPVDWYPWGDEAFEKAKREQKMIFLSVGYAACHWCHVMERESFEDPEIAEAMNQRFVCVKVDSEERPDVDQIYMQAVQIISRGSGGWPMSLFLLPDGRPFWGGTYFPARTGDRGEATGFLTIIQQIDRGWKEKQDAVVQQAETLTNAIQESHLRTPPPSVELTSSLVSDVADALADQFDSDYGGFGVADGQEDRPKFPEPSNLVFLIDRIRRPTVNEFARESAERMLRMTLDGMISGALIDHIGGGFHRYSVDRRWQIPHFEKMLYDNGQLASVFSEVYADTKNYEYGNVVIGICDFVLRELRAPGGAFYSALDADSEGEEGKFYRWSKDELESLEQIQGFADFADVYRLNGKPNFESDFFVPDPGKSLTAVGKQRNEFIGDLIIRLDPVRKQLLEIRGKRERPMTDTKILTAWNGLMIAGLADAGRIMKRVDYTTAAAEAADFVLQNLQTEDGRLYRSYAKGNASLNAYLNDYAFLTSGLIALHRATEDQRWLEAAIRVTDKQLELFWDEPSRGFFFTSNDHSSLIVRTKSETDSAIPSGTSVSAENLLYLARMTDNQTYQNRLRETLESLAPSIQKQPAAAPRAAAVLAAYLDQE